MVSPKHGDPEAFQGYSEQGEVGADAYVEFQEVFQL